MDSRFGGFSTTDSEPARKEMRGRESGVKKKFLNEQSMVAAWDFDALRSTVNH